MISKMKLKRIMGGLRQSDLQEKTGIPQWRLSLIERGLAPKDDEALRIASALGAEVEFLFPGGNGEPQKQPAMAGHKETAS